MQSSLSIPHSTLDTLLFNAMSLCLVTCTANVLPQILMGTVYVFCEQLVQEMLVVYSVGSHEKYKRLVFWHYIFFCGGACACAPIAVSLFELLGFANTFYTAAVWASVSGVAFATFFAARFARTAEGILGKYDAAEAELRGC